jgi:spermidine/putrescine transport system permease protein
MHADAHRSGPLLMRLGVLLLFAPVVLWLLGLIILPHVELAYLSLRVRLAPRMYEPSLAQYRMMFEEPLYLQTFLRTAAISIVSTVLTLFVCFPVAWTIAKIARHRVRPCCFCCA